MSDEINIKDFLNKNIQIESLLGEVIISSNFVNPVLTVFNFLGIILSAVSPGKEVV